MAAKIDTEIIENYLSNLGKQDSKGKVYFERILFNIKTLKSGVKIVLDSPDTEPVLKNFKSKMIKTLMEKFKGGALTKVEEKVKGINKNIETPVIRLRYSDKGQKHIDFDVREYPKPGKKGSLKPAISEPATMLILNAALDSKGKEFKSEQDIFVHDVYKDLEKLFGKEWGHKLDEWIYTFLHQNILFFKNYSRSTWATFKHKDYKGQRDMQVFFAEHLKTLQGDPGIEDKARNYTQWNPADIWAVKRSEQGTLEQEIEKASKSPSANTLMKLNIHIVKLMEKKELVGISLKKIESGDMPKFKIYNVDSSRLLTNLKAFSKLEEFGMGDIYFELRNVFANFPGNESASSSSSLKKVPAATTYILFGNKVPSSAKFQVAVTRSGVNIVFNTSIPSARGAQGGQTLKQFVLRLLRDGGASNVTFDNNFKDYPATGEDFADIIQDPTSPEYKKYEKWFNFVHKHKKNNYKNGITFETWADGVYEAYEARMKDGMGIAGVTKLALLNFWYDALKNHGDDPDFWSDILYYGMKVTTKGQFGPHAKIS